MILRVGRIFFEITTFPNIQCFVQGSSVGVRVNNDIEHYFQTMKGLWEEYPLSPILFIIVVNMLAIIITRAKVNGQVDGGIYSTLCERHYHFNRA